MKGNDFLKGPILPSLMKFAIPVMFALFLQALYAAVDLWAVGTFATPQDMAAVSTASQVMLVITSFITGISMGITVHLGHMIGKDEKRKASYTMGASVYILVVFSVAVTLCLTLGANQIATFVHIPESAFSQMTSYLRICGFGLVFITAYNIISAIFRGIGNSKLPLVFVAIAAVCNMIGDIILIKHFGLGATGAAIATVFAQMISVILSLVFMKKYHFPFPIDKEAFKYNKACMKEVLHLGFPIACVQMCNEIYYLILMGFVNQLGVTESAGVGVAEKLIVFLVLIPMSFMSSISSFVATNDGANQNDRSKKGMFEGMIVSGILGLVLASLLYLKGDVLASFFNNDQQVITAAHTFLKATSLECFLLSIAYCLTGYFNGTGRTNFVMLQGLFVVFFVKTPYAFYAMTKQGNQLVHLGLSTVLGALSSLIICIIAYLIFSKKEQNALVQNQATSHS